MNVHHEKHTAVNFPNIKQNERLNEKFHFGNFGVFNAVV